MLEGAALPVLKERQAAVVEAQQARVELREVLGDVRPETLQVCFKGMGKVTGYGVTTIAELARRSRNDSGRDAYTAPEQAYGGRAAATVQTDVYALGCVLYEALTGKAPFAADSDLAEVMMRDELARPQHADITEAMCQAVLRATRKKSTERYASALELRSQILDGQGLQVSTRAGSRDAADHRTACAQIHLLKRRYRGGPCLCPAVAAPPQLAVEPRRGLCAAAAGLRPA